MVLAVAGLIYTAESLYRVASGAVDEIVKDSRTPYFYPAFYVMASISAIFYLVLMFFGVRFVRLRSEFWWLFPATLAAEVIYFFGIGYWLWPHPTLGPSVAAATGISSGGLMFQFFLLFPLWAPILVFVARRSENRSVS